MRRKRLSESEKSMLKGLNGLLKNRPAFICACCKERKHRDKAEGVHLYRTDDPALRKALLDEKGQERVGTYVICIQCVDSLPKHVIHQNVTRCFRKAGLFNSSALECPEGHKTGGFQELGYGERTHYMMTPMSKEDLEQFIKDVVQGELVVEKLRLAGELQQTVANLKEKGQEAVALILTALIKSIIKKN